MRPLALLAALVLAAGPSAASDPAPSSDAPAATPAPQPLSWRVAPANENGSIAPMTTPSRGKLRDFKMMLTAAPDCKEKAVLGSAVDALIAGADAAKPQDQQLYIDTHLGELNTAVRALSKDMPKDLAVKAAASASELNNAAERWEDGRDMADVALGFDPEDKDALIGRSQASAGLGDYARAYADADAVLRKAPDEARGWTSRAAASYGLGNYLQAVEDARRALAVDPNDKTAHMLMKLAEGRAQAAPAFDSSASMSASVEREYHGMIQQLNQVESIRQAPPEHPTEKALRRFLDSSGSKLAVKDYRGAIEEADKALAVSPQNPDALYYRAAAENLLGRYGEAERDATAALALAPSNAPLRDTRSWAYTRMGRFTDAIADANHSLEINPKNPYAFANRGHAHEGRGDYQSMAVDLKAAAELNAAFEPDYRDSTRRYGMKSEALKGQLLPAEERAPSRARSFALVMVFSIAGGLLIGLGLMHVGTGLREAREAKAPKPAPAAPAGAGFETHYELGKAIGQGGMGVVYEARDRRLGRPVAVKMLRDEFQLDDAAKKAFVEEARTVAELHHPSIVDIHAVEQDERGLYLVFERLEGRTLDELITEQKRLPLSEIKRILEPVCSALAYAHARDVVHRDLKPGNVMLTKEGGVKVLDWGISRHTARAGKPATTTQTVVGTPHYMAPEQEYGFVRRENDVFALGAMLYEMVTGVRPYEGPTPAKLAKSYVRPSRRVSGLSPELDALIDRALEPDPEKRIPSPVEFWQQLDSIASRAS